MNISLQAWHGNKSVVKGNFLTLRLIIHKNRRLAVGVVLFKPHIVTLFLDTNTLWQRRMESQDYQPIDSSYIPFMAHLWSYPTDWLIFAALSILALLLLVGLSSAKERKDILAETKMRKPSTYPFTIPFVGHALSMVWNPDKFLFAVT